MRTPSSASLPPMIPDHKPQARWPALGFSYDTSKIHKCVVDKAPLAPGTNTVPCYWISLLPHQFTVKIRGYRKALELQDWPRTVGFY